MCIRTQLKTASAAPWHGLGHPYGARSWWRGAQSTGRLSAAAARWCPSVTRCWQEGVWELCGQGGFPAYSPPRQVLLAVEGLRCPAWLWGLPLPRGFLQAGQGDGIVQTQV